MLVTQLFVLMITDLIITKPLLRLDGTENIYSYFP
jgi:hypothetical protein